MPNPNIKEFGFKKGYSPDRYIKQKGAVSFATFTRKNARKRCVAKDAVDGTSRRMTLAEQLDLKLWKMALDGDLGAIKELYERIDGRVPTLLQHSGNNGMPLIPPIVIFESNVKVADASDAGKDKMLYAPEGTRSIKHEQTL
jgi:hypothetical protein